MRKGRNTIYFLIKDPFNGTFAFLRFLPRLSYPCGDTCCPPSSHSTIIILSPSVIFQPFRNPLNIGINQNLKARLYAQSEIVQLGDKFDALIQQQQINNFSFSSLHNIHYSILLTQCCLKHQHQIIGKLKLKKNITNLFQYYR